MQSKGGVGFKDCLPERGSVIYCIINWRIGDTISKTLTSLFEKIEVEIYWSCGWRCTILLFIRLQIILKMGQGLEDYIFIEEIMSSKRSISEYHDFIAKVILIGDAGVGKTNMLTRFAEEDYKQSYVATIGVDFKLKTIVTDGHKIKLQIWDTAGQERFRNITQTYYKGASGIILTYAINSLTSFKNVTVWLKQLENTTTDICCKILVGTKLDLEYLRQVATSDGKDLADRHGMLFIEASSKTSQNIQDVFMELTRAMRAKRAGVETEPETTANLSKRISSIAVSKFNKKCC